MKEPIQDPKTLDYLKAWPQYLMPGHLLSRLMLGVTRITLPAFKDRLIGWFVDRFRVDMAEAEETDPHAYRDFNSFFTRALRADARPLVTAPDAIACPVDGRVSQAGSLSDGRIIQAKGHDYTVRELLGGEPEQAAPFLGGSFATLYLSPRDYHRIHMPVDGTLTTMIHVPGRLFSVSPATTRAIPRLFARNERVVTLFDTPAGPMALVMVAAVFVGGIETAWQGPVTPPAARTVQLRRYRGEDAPRLERGQELGRFNMGSTVVLLFGPGAVEWADKLRPGAPVRMGQLLASRTQAPG